MAIGDSDKKAKLTRRVGWHTFGHPLYQIVGPGGQVVRKHAVRFIEKPYKHN